MFSITKKKADSFKLRQEQKTEVSCSMFQRVLNQQNRKKNKKGTFK